MPTSSKKTRGTDLSALLEKLIEVGVKFIRSSNNDGCGHRI